MHIGWPQGIILALAFTAIGISLAKDGEPKGNWSFVTTLISMGVEMGLLYWGGFFG